MYAGILSRIIFTRALPGYLYTATHLVNCSNDDHRVKPVSATSLDWSISCFGTCNRQDISTRMWHSARRVCTSVTYESIRQWVPIHKTCSSPRVNPLRQSKRCCCAFMVAVLKRSGIKSRDSFIQSRFIALAFHLEKKLYKKGNKDSLICLSYT